MTKSHMVKVDGRLHAAFKAAGRQEHRYTIQALSELGMLLVLIERGVIADMDDALALGASPKPAVLLKRILEGEAW